MRQPSSGRSGVEQLHDPGRGVALEAGPVLVPARGSQSASRAAGILLLLTDEGRPLSLTEIAQKLQLAKSSTLAVLVSLEGAELVRRSDVGYWLGPAVLRLAGGFLQGFDIVAEFKQTVSSFPALQGEVVQLATLVGRDAVFLARHIGRGPLLLTATVGDRFPASITAVGTAMLALLSDDEVSELYSDSSRFDRWTADSTSSLPQLLEKLHRTRAQGYAVDERETHPDVLGLAVVVHRSSRYASDVAVGAALRPPNVPEEQRQRVVADLMALRDSLEVTNVLE